MKRPIKENHKRFQSLYLGSEPDQRVGLSGFRSVSRRESGVAVAVAIGRSGADVAAVCGSGRTDDIGTGVR